MEFHPQVWSNLKILKFKEAILWQNFYLPFDRKCSIAIPRKEMETHHYEQALYNIEAARYDGGDYVYESPMNIL